MPIVELDAGLSALLETDGAVRVATGFQFTEGPVWHRDGFLLFSDIPANRIMRWNEADGVAVWREPSGQSNGLTFDRQGRLLAAEHAGRRVSRTLADGTIEAVAERYRGRRLHSPNDLVEHSAGAIYFTDPPYGGNPAELDQFGVYRVVPGGEITLLAADFQRPNGLAFSPDESTLYVDDTARHHIRAFTVADDGALRDGRVFAEMDGTRNGAADGMKVDADGRVFCTGPGGCYVYEPDGRLLGLLVLPEPPANCAWGDDDRQSLYLTARTSVYRVRLKVRGLAAM